MAAPNNLHLNSMRTLSCQQALTSEETIAHKQDIATNTAIPAFHIFDRVKELPLTDWHDLVPETKPYLRYDFLAAIEAAAPKELSFRYVLVYKGRQPISFNYFQIASFDVSKTVGYTKLDGGNKGVDKIKNSALKIFKRLLESWNVNLLVGGNVFLSCEGSHHYFDSQEEEKGFEYLLQASKEIQNRERKIHGTLLKDFYKTDTHPQAYIENAGYHFFKAEPNMVLKLAPEWETFQDYLGAMSSKYRQRAKSAYKKSKAIESRELSLEEVVAAENRIDELFQKVVAEDKFAVAEAGPGYFTELKRVLGDQLRVEGYFLEGEMVAFMTSILNPEHLEAHFLGFEASLNRSHKIYQRILYDIVYQAIESKAGFISYGRTALEIKSTVGAEPQEMNLYLKLSNNLFNRLITPIMKKVEMDHWEQRHPFK